jgi:DNA-binding MarR family transcriptional regulator
MQSATDVTADREAFPPALLDRVGFLLSMAKGGAEAICGDALSEVGITARQLGILTVLETEGPHSQQSLAEWMRLDRTTMVALIDALEGPGFVRRERNPDDRRAYLLQTTAAGRRVQQRGMKLLLRAEERFLATLSAGERVQLRELLAKIAADVGKPLENR